jgi:hypothetical protein
MARKRKPMTERQKIAAQFRSILRNIDKLEAQLAALQKGRSPNKRSVQKAH